MNTPSAYLSYLLILVFTNHMSEEQTHHEGAPTKSAIAQMLLGKVISHKVFSDRMLYWLLLGIAFILPIFFIPSQAVAPEFAKMILLEVVVLFGIFAWAVGRLRDGKVEIPKSLLLSVSVLLVLQFVVAAFVSPAPLVSFIGSGYDLGTVNAFVILFLLMFLSSVVFSDRDRVLSLYAAFIFSGSIIMVYQFARHFFGANFLSFAVFTSDVATPVGKWNDLASLIGGMMLMVLTTLYFFPSNKTLKLPSYVIFIVGLFFLLLIDFTVLWLILVVFTGALMALAVREGEATHKQKTHEALQSGSAHPHKPVHKRVVGHIPVLAGILLAVSLVYVSGLSTLPWGAQNVTIANTIGKFFRAAPYSEVVLTPKTTYEVIKASLQEAPFFGTGPNRFAQSFLLHKSSEINRTPFWDTAFDFGLGRIPTYFGTTGIIGMLLWLIFVVLLFMKSRHIVRLFAKDRIAAYLASSLFLMTLYFWSLAFFYLPNTAIFSLSFLFTGALIAFLVGEGVIGRYSLSFSGTSRLSFVLTPVIVIVLVGASAGGVLLYRQVSSLVSYREAQLAIAVNDIDKAEAAVKHANSFSERDLYLRDMSNIALVRLGRLPNNNTDQADFQAKANALIVLARGDAERAITVDPSNFENYLQLGGVYDTLGSLGIQGTAEPARLSYEQALRLNPKSPRVLFVLARLEYVAGDHAKARTYLQQALAERPNYLEAVSFLVQLDLQDKNVDDAVAVLKASTAAEPTNFLLHFALGYLNYIKRDNQAAMNEFEAAVILNPLYADAKYFLGLTYERAGRHQDAITQFSDVLTLNPDNKEVANILKNLKSGRDPFAPPYVAPSQPVNDALKVLNKSTDTKAAN